MTNLPAIAPPAPSPVKRPRWWKRLFEKWRATFIKVKCPLCGSSKTYPVEGMIPWQDAANELVRGKWSIEQGLTGVPLPPSKAVTQTLMPGFEESTTYSDEEHQRCTNCRALLPPQYWATFVGRDVAIAVTGAAEHGKTTWLLSMLNPPEIDTYEILRRTRNVIATSYEYAEPYTIEILTSGLRTSVPFTMLGSTVQRDSESVHIRTLDIRGEHFTPRNLPKTRKILKRHLRRTRVGALLVVDRFIPETTAAASQSQAPQPQPSLRNLVSVGRTYEEISMDLRETIDELWKFVIWTFLDCAEWSPDAEQLLRGSSLKSDAQDSLIAIARGAFPDSRTVTANALSIVSPAMVDAIHDLLPEDASMSQVEGFIALMFRLQLLYALAAARSPTTKYDFYEKGGKNTVSAIVRLAGKLYKRTDALRGTGVGGFISDQKDPWQVFPCGRIGDQSVWSDLILVRAVDAVS